MALKGEQEFAAEIEAPIAQCYVTIIDFETYPEWCSPIERAKILEYRPGKEKRARFVDFSIDMKLRTVRYVLEYDYEKPTRLTWHSVDGDVESVAGEYVFEKLAANRTRATCRQAVSLGFWIPGPIRALAERQALKQSVLEFKAEAERRRASKSKKQ